MPRPTLAYQLDTDRNLLFGVLALHIELIDEEQFIEACRLWAARKPALLADVLVERGWITPADRADVERLLARKLRKHGNDVKAGLSGVLDPATKSRLARLGDDAIRHSMAGLAAAGSPVETGPYVAAVRDRYRLDALHATGGIGRIWRAHDGKLGREVALKELRPNLDDSPPYVARFLHEARITGQLEHPGIVPVYELGQDPQSGNPFYVMRFIRGRTLSRAIAAYHEAQARGRAGPVEVRVLIQALLTVCHAVAYAHSRGVLHRDLKGQNIVLGDFGEVVVLDWGLAKLIHPNAPTGDLPPVGPGAAGGPAETQPGQAIGTPSYMAPEQAAGRLDRIDERTDVYGLGAILYEILTNRPPFPGTDRDDVLRRAREGKPPPPRSIAPGSEPALGAVCVRALELDPRRRYAAAAAVARELQKWLADEPLEAYRERFPARAAHWGRRHRTLVAATAAVVLSAFVALAVSTVLIVRQQALTEAALRQSDRNYKDAQAERGRAESNAATAQAARRRADGNFQKAQSAVDYLLTRVSQDENFLAHEPHLEGLRRALLQDALAFYLDFLDAKSNDPEVRRETMHAYRRVGNLRQDLGDHAEAEKAYVAARDLGQNLAAEFPGEPQYEQELGAIANSLGILFHGTGRLADARAAYLEAQGHKRQLAADYPDVARYQEEVANTLHNLSAVLRELGSAAEAEAANREAIDWRQALVDRPDALPEYRHYLVKDLLALATLQEDNGLPVRQEDTLRQALRLQEELVKDYTLVPNYREDLALCHNNLGILLRKVKRLDEAEEQQLQSLDLRSRLAQDFPRVPTYRNELGSSLRSLALLRLDQGRPQEARAKLQDARGLQSRLADEFPFVPAFRDNLSITWLDLGLVFRVLERPEDAEDALRQAMRQREQLPREYREAPENQSRFGLTLHSLALLHLERKQYREAERVLEQAVACQRAARAANPHQLAYVRLLRRHYAARAEALSLLKDVPRLAALARDWYQASEDSGPDCYQAACRLARCISLVKEDDGLPAARREELAMTYGDEAMKILGDALQKGGVQRQRLGQAEELKVLGNREEFRKLASQPGTPPQKEK